MFKLTKEQLLLDLYVAFYAARKHKSRKWYVRKFESNLHSNLVRLRDDLWNRTYKNDFLTCFLIDCPCKREIFAAAFRDRIVHHLYFNYTHLLYERTFIYDSYSCIKHKGTTFGIERLKHHILSESENYAKTCYCLQVDIRGYFMNINRDILLKIALDSIDKQAYKWENTIDIVFIKYLTEVIITLDPLKESIIKGDIDDYEHLPKHKTLFNSPYHCGLPIGNLTSQLFSNVYLNKLDQFIKRILKAKHYGRYVDDSYIVSCNKEWLVTIIPLIETFLKKELGLTMHKGKTKITNVKYGIEFLGAFIKPFRMYISNKTLIRMKKHIINLNLSNKFHYISSILSYIGILKHYATYNIRKTLFIFNHGN